MRPPISFVALLVHVVYARLATVTQNDTFDSSYTLTPGQIETADLNTALVESIELALNFERSNQAGSSVHNDPFYTSPPSDRDSPPGTLLKLEEITNTTLYSLPPGLALSRIIYMTTTSNGTAVPTSAYILWPYTPRTLPDGFPIVAWARGFSGFTSECAPSRNRKLWNDYNAPFPLALAGYVVVAPDWAGIGVRETSDGRAILAESFVATGHGNDVLYAIDAAQAAFSSLSSKFVILGHSEGAIAAWGAARLQLQRRIPGYLGTVVASPWWPTFFQLPLSAEDREPKWLSTYTSPAIVHAMRSLDPVFDIRDFMTETGAGLYKLIVELGGCLSVHQTMFLFQDPDALRPGWGDLETYQQYANLTRNAGFKVSGPMLILQATGDATAEAGIAQQMVNETCEAFPESQIEYIEINVTGHGDVVFAGQHVWMDWIRERFYGSAEEAAGCSWEWRSSTALPDTAYVGAGQYFLEYSTSPYQLA